MKIPDLSISSKWNKVIVTVLSDNQGITYSVEIKDALNGNSYYKKSVDDLGATGTKLFTDALFASSQSTLGVIIHLGDVNSITEVVPSIQAKKMTIIVMNLTVMLFALIVFLDSSLMIITFVRILTQLDVLKSLNMLK